MEAAGDVVGEVAAVAAVEEVAHPFGADVGLGGDPDAGGVPGLLRVGADLGHRVVEAPDLVAGGEDRAVHRSVSPGRLRPRSWKHVRSGSGTYQLNQHLNWHNNLTTQTGRDSSREGVFHYVWISVCAVSFT